MVRIDEAYFQKQFPQRKRDAHKGDFGKVLIFAGSRGMAGAAVLAASAAVKSGAGLVQFLLPSFADPLYPILQTTVPEATCVTPERIGFYASENGTCTCENLFDYRAIAAGCGLGSDPARMHLLQYIIDRYTGTLILDADALNAAASGSVSKDSLCRSKAQIILTPHIGEAKRLLENNASIRTQKERLAAVKKLAKTYACTALLKGQGTLIYKEAANGESVLFENTTGNPGMATGGSGDVLTGIIAAFAAQGLAPEAAAACAAYVHGKAGDLAAEALGEISMSARDLLTYLPQAFLA